MVKFIRHTDTLDLDKSPGLYAIRDLLHLVVAHEHLHRHGIREVRQIKDQNGLLILNLPLVKIQDLTADHHLAELADELLDPHGLLFKIPAVEHIRIVAAAHTAAKIAPLAESAFCRTAGRFATGLAGLSASFFARTAGRFAAPLAALRAHHHILAAGRYASDHRRSCSCFFLLTGFHSARTALCRIRLQELLPGSVRCTDPQPLLNLMHPKLQPDLIFLCKLSCLHFFISSLHCHFQSAALHQDLLQDPHQFFLFGLHQHGVLQRKQYHSLLRIGDIRLLERTVHNMVMRLQFQQDTVLIQFQKLLCIILGRKRKMFVNLDLQPRARKQLACDLLLGRKNIRLLDQSCAEQINAQEIPAFR